MMRTMQRLSLATTLFALVAAPIPVVAQDVALLLGQRETTMLVVVHGDSVTVRRGLGLIVPRATGWWRVGVDQPTPDYPELHDRLYPAWRADSIRADSTARAELERPSADTVPRTDTAQEPVESEQREMNMHGEELGHEVCFGHIIWAVPLGSVPTLGDTDCAEGEEAAGEYGFTFVSPAVVTMYGGITTDYSYNFTRGTLDATFDSVARHPLNSIGHRGYEEGDPDPHPALGVPAGDRAWAREANRCNIEYNRGIREGNDADTVAWDYQGSWIARRAGRWRYVRYYANTSYVGRGMESDCVVRIPVPERLTGWDRLTVPLATIRKRVPKLVDAFTSPGSATGKGIAFVIDSTAMRVFRVEKGALGRELGRIAQPANLSFIDVTGTTMSQWATGAGARRWESELAAVLPVTVPVLPPRSKPVVGGRSSD